LIEFHLFSKLPEEMRNKIWKQFSKLEPRIVTVDWTPCPGPKDANKMPIIYHIDRNTRRNTLKQYGYIVMEHPLTDKKVLFHPELDLLHITETVCSVYPKGAQLIKTSLDNCGALSRIRSVAIAMHISLPRYFATFSHYTSLELVLGVWKYKEVEDEGTVSTFSIEDWEVAACEYAMSAINRDRKECQLLMQRDSGVTPLWREVNHQQLLPASEKVPEEDYNGNSKGESGDSSEDGDS
jgi:hypothetical protein